MYKYRIRLETNTDDVISLSGEFPKGDWERLLDFTKYSMELLDTRYVQSGMNSSLKMNWDSEQGLKLAVELPPWDDVVVFLHRFRPIGLVSESTYFLSICNVLTKEIEHSYFRNLVGLERKRFQGVVLGETWKIKINDVLVNSEKTLSYWLNGYEYHRDKDKRELIEELQKVLPGDMLKAVFLALLVEKTKAINNVSALVNVLTGKQKAIKTVMKLEKQETP